MMRILESGRLGILLASLVAFGAAAGCSKNDPASPRDLDEDHGVSIAPAGTVEIGGPLLWSGHTHELIAASAFLSGESGLVAIHATTGEVRTLDTTVALPLELAPDGSAVYYLAIAPGPSADSLAVRRVALAPGAAERTLAACEFLCLPYLVPAPDGDRVAIGMLGDSIEILQITNGLRTRVGTGRPRVFSPEGGRLLVHDSFEPLVMARILDLATRASRPANLGVPDTIEGGHLRWDDEGIEVAYVTGSRRLEWRRVSAGTTVAVWTSPDTVFAVEWAPSGARAAVWTSRILGGGWRRWDLVGVDFVSRTARVLAHGREDRSGRTFPGPFARLAPAADIFPPRPPSGMAFSPDESQVAYAWFDGSVHRASWSGASARAW